MMRLNHTSFTRVNYCFTWIFLSGQFQRGLAIVYLHTGLHDFWSMSLFSIQTRTQNFRNVRLFLSCGEMVGETPADLGPNRFILIVQWPPVILSCLKKNIYIFVHVLDLIKLLLAMLSASCLLLTGGIS